MMKIKILKNSKILIFVFLFFLQGCYSQKIQINFDSIGNLSPKSAVIFENDSIGYVKSIHSFDSNHLVEIDLDDFSLSDIDPEFYLVDPDGKTKILIISKNSENILDTINFLKGKPRMNYYFNLFKYKFDDFYRNFNSYINLFLKEVEKSLKGLNEKFSERLKKYFNNQDRL